MDRWLTKQINLFVWILLSALAMAWPFTFLPRDNYCHSKDCRNLCWVYTSRFVRGYQVLLQMLLQVSPSNWPWFWSNNNWNCWNRQWGHAFTGTKHYTLVWRCRKTLLVMLYNNTENLICEKKGDLLKHRGIKHRFMSALQPGFRLVTTRSVT